MNERTERDVVRAIAALTLRPGSPITPDLTRQVLETARAERVNPGKVLAERINETDLLSLLADELNVAFIDVADDTGDWTIDANLVAELGRDTLRTATALPLSDASGQVMVAFANPFVHAETRNYLDEKIPGYVVALASGAAIRRRLDLIDTTAAVEELHDDDTTGTGRLGSLLSTRTTAAGGGTPTAAVREPVVEWIDSIFARAAVEGVSDVHMMHKANGELLVRFRVDGILLPQPVPRSLAGRSGEVIGSLLSRCPTIDVTDKSRHQDGTFSFTVPGGKRIDTRVALLPQANGPTVVTRLLDPDNVRRRLDDMGFAPDTLEALRTAMAAPQGMVLLVGPTGSGKTTTLWGLINELDAMSKHILTAEDPIEYRLPNIGQTQIRADLGEKSLTFAKALRAFMRMDPDVMLVGEIRDTETAEAALQAASTGHLLLSTLHTNSALGSVQRLNDLGVDGFAVAETLTLSASQRLIRRVHTCASWSAPDAGEEAFLGRQGLPVPEQVRRAAPRGCGGCNNTGYRGRIAVLEAFVPDAHIKTLIAQEAPMSQIRQAALDRGHVTIMGDAYRHVVSGETTVSELVRCLDGVR